MATNAELESRLDALEQDYLDSVNGVFTFVMTIFVFLMQLGFALLEAGAVKSKNVKHIMHKNLMDGCLCCVCFYLVGFGIVSGEDGAVFPTTSKNFAGPELASMFSFFYQFTFCSATSTILSGAVASRMVFTVYMFLTMMTSVIAFPIFSYWLWNPDGWLNPNNDFLPVLDFAGGLAVHTLGGFAGLAGSWICGPRSYRFEEAEDGKRIDHGQSGHSVVLSFMGTFFLWCGWFGFNCGSIGEITGGNWASVGRCATNTALTPALAAICSYLFSWYSKDVHDIWDVLSAILAGAVCITPAASFVPTWACFVFGPVGYASYKLTSVQLASWGIDDPVEAVGVHGTCGIVGTLLTNLLAEQNLVNEVYGEGVFDYDPSVQLGRALVGCLVAAAIGFCFTAFPLWIMRDVFKLDIRVTSDDEVVGLDFKYHAGYAYPDFNKKVRIAHERMRAEKIISQRVRKSIAGDSKRYQSSRASSQLPSPRESSFSGKVISVSNSATKSHSHKPSIEMQSEVSFVDARKDANV